MKYVTFEVDVATWVTCEADPDDDWSRASTDGDVTILKAVLTNKEAFDSLPVPDTFEVGNKIFLVWAQYSTGDSFGSDGGQYELLAVYPTYEEAKQSKEHYEKVTDFSVPWNGYFERLDGIYIDEFTLEESL